MKRLALSSAGSALVRSLINRALDHRDRILLTGVQSRDWQSLTFTGERHQIWFRVIGERAREVALTLTDGLADHEFSIPGAIVADIAATTTTDEESGTVLVQIEALTIEA